jgi:hypothetical protein
MAAGTRPRAPPPRASAERRRIGADAQDRALVDAGGEPDQRQGGKQLDRGRGDETNRAHVPEHDAGRDDHRRQRGRNAATCAHVPLGSWIAAIAPK